MIDVDNLIKMHAMLGIVDIDNPKVEVKAEDPFEAESGDDVCIATFWEGNLHSRYTVAEIVFMYLTKDWE